MMSDLELAEELGILACAFTLNVLKAEAEGLSFV